MSIVAALRELQSAGALVPYRSTNTRKRARRRLFLTTTAKQHWLDPESATNILCGRGPIQAAMDRWVLGDRIYGSGTVRYLADLEPPPPEIWEIRVTEPNYQVRLFGRFAEPDTLILTAFHTRKYLGSKGSQAWTDAMADCVRQWEAFTPALPVFEAATIHEYVTENCDDFSIKNRTRNGRRTRSARTRGIRGGPIS